MVCLVAGLKCKEMPTYLTQRQISHLQNLQRRNTISGARANRTALGIDGLAGPVIELDMLMRVITEDKRMEVINSAIPIALSIYKSMVPRSKKKHFFYAEGDKNKLGIGSGKNREYQYEIHPGNLQRSIKPLHLLLKKYRWKTGVIGPHYNRGQSAHGKQVLADENNTNGFYAHMVFGSAKAWKSRIVNKAGKAARQQVFTKMVHTAKSVIDTTKKNWWESK